MVDLAREPARRLFAEEIRRSTVKTDGKPSYVITPLGTRVSRVMIAGVVTRVAEKNPEYNVYLIGVADPTGSVAMFVSKFNPEALSMFLDQKIQEFDRVGIVGKLRVVEIGNFLRPVIRVEAINRISKEDYILWQYEALKYLLKRIKEFNPENEIVRDIYHTKVEHYEELAEKVKEALRDELNIQEPEFVEESFDIEDILSEDDRELFS